VSSNIGGGKRGVKQDDKGQGRGDGRKGRDGQKRRAYEGNGGPDEGFINFFHLPNSNGSVKCVFLDVSIWQKQLANLIELKKFESQRIQSRMSSF